MTTEVKSASAKKNEDWMNSKWRPMMGWSYMLTCIADFVIFPVLWSLLQAMDKGTVTIQWQPITLQGAGLYHIAMGAVLGIAAFGRTQEKLGGANNGGLAPVSQSVTTTFGSSSTGGFGAPSSFGSPTPNSFSGGRVGSTSSGFGTEPTSTAGGFNASATGQVITGFGGKPAPFQPQQPEL